jgi:hypothetical protein
MQRDRRRVSSVLLKDRAIIEANAFTVETPGL